jgi:hypothetical protein
VGAAVVPEPLDEDWVFTFTPQQTIPQGGFVYLELTTGWNLATLAALAGPNSNQQMAPRLILPSGQINTTTSVGQEKDNKWIRITLLDQSIADIGVELRFPKEVLKPPTDEVIVQRAGFPRGGSATPIWVKTRNAMGELLDAGRVDLWLFTTISRTLVACDAPDSPTGLLVTTPNALLESASTTAGEDLEEAIDDSSTAVAAESISTSGAGTNLALSYRSSSTAIISITVTASGSGYHVGDTITVAAAAMPGRSTNAVFIFVEDDLVPRTLVTTTDALLGSASTTAGEDLEEAIDDSASAVAAGLISTSGAGTGLAISYRSSATHITSITVTASGSGYHVGDTVTISATAMAGRSTAAVFTLVEDDFVPRIPVTVPDALMGSASSVTGEGLSGMIDTTSIAVVEGSVSTSGSGTGLALLYRSSATHIIGITVTASGIGYQVGNTITISAAAMPGRSTDAVFTLVKDDLVPLRVMSTDVDGIGGGEGAGGMVGNPACATRVGRDPEGDWNITFTTRFPDFSWTRGNGNNLITADDASVNGGSVVRPDRAAGGVVLIDFPLGFDLSRMDPQNVTTSMCSNATIEFLSPHLPPPYNMTNAIRVIVGPGSNLMSPSVGAHSITIARRSLAAPPTAPGNHRIVVSTFFLGHEQLSAGSGRGAVERGTATITSFYAPTGTFVFSPSIVDAGSFPPAPYWEARFTLNEPIRAQGRLELELAGAWNASGGFWHAHRITPATCTGIATDGTSTCDSSTADSSAACPAGCVFTAAFTTNTLSHSLRQMQKGMALIMVSSDGTPFNASQCPAGSLWRKPWAEHWAAAGGHIGPPGCQMNFTATMRNLNASSSSPPIAITIRPDNGTTLEARILYAVVIRGAALAAPPETGNLTRAVSLRVFEFQRGEGVALRAVSHATIEVRPPRLSLPLTGQLDMTNCLGFNATAESIARALGAPRAVPSCVHSNGGSGWCTYFQDDFNYKCCLRDSSDRLNYTALMTTTPNCASATSTCTAKCFVIATGAAPRCGVVTTVDALVGSASAVEGEDLAEAITAGIDVAVAAGSITADPATGRAGLALKYTTGVGTTTDVPASCTGTATDGTSTCVATDSKDACPAGCVFTAAFTTNTLTYTCTIESTDFTSSTQAIAAVVTQATSGAAGTLVTALNGATETAAVMVSTNGIPFTATGSLTIGDFASTKTPTAVVVGAASMESITVTASGSGYRVGDKITIAHAAMAGRATDAVFILAEGDVWGACGDTEAKCAALGATHTWGSSATTRSDDGSFCYVPRTDVHQFATQEMGRCGWNSTANEMVCVPLGG